MTQRVFISYRTSDGADKATALARDLDALFGSDQIFLDKDDLPAGSRWRDGIARALDGGPILLVLVTPNYLGAADAQGRRCIDRADDPVRTELEAGIAASATIVPLLCDGVTATPPAATLPAPFAQLSERQWGRLRAFDWRSDLARLAEDLARLGVVRKPAAAATPSDGRRRRAIVVGAGAVGLAGAAGFAWRWSAGREPLSGAWRGRIGRRGADTARDGDPLAVVLEQRGNLLTFTSNAIDVERDPQWENHRDYWKQRFGVELRQVFYRGHGAVALDDASGASPFGIGPVVVSRISLAMSIAPPGDVEPLDGGSMRGTVDPDQSRIHANFWINSERAERVVELRRA